MSDHAAPPTWLDQYEALVRGAGLVLLDRTQIELAGDDRARFMHNLCTNEVKKLQAGAGCEAFVTSVQGKTLGHGFVFVGPEAIVFDTVAGQGEVLLKHFDKYLVSERVELTDRTGEWSELLVAGPRAEAIVASLASEPLPDGHLANATIEVAGTSVWLRRVDITGPVGFLVSTAWEQAAALVQALRESGATDCEPAAFEAARIERGFPLYGRDISDQNLPQEVNRDALAISFTKGCYLGQETVARIDALGHVNKLLVGLRFLESTVPEAGLELTCEGQSAGHVTSTTYSPLLAAPLALGYVRRGHEAPGTRLDSAGGEAEVVALPVG